MRYLRWILTLVVVGLIATFAVASLYGWLLGLKILETMYSSKAGVDYIATWTLKFYLFYASALLAILSMITMPQRSTFLSFMSAIVQPNQVVRVLKPRTALLWRIFEFIAFFSFYVAIGGYSITGQNVAFLWMLMGDGSISITSEQFGTLFALPFSPSVSSATVVSLVPAMEAYQFYLGLVSTLVGATAVRFLLSLIVDMAMPKRDTYVIASKLLLLAALGVLVEILGVPMWTVNAGTWMTYGALLIALGSSILGSFMFLMMRLRSGDVQTRLRGKIAQLEEDLAHLQGELISVRQEFESGTVTADDYKRRVNLLVEDRANISGELKRLKLERLIPFGPSPKRFAFMAVFLIMIVITMPAIQAVYYGIQMDGDKYIDWKFNMETEKEIAITNWAAGVDGMEGKVLSDLTYNVTPESEVEFLTTVRQWDQSASYLRMKNQIGTNWMQLADSDIVFLKQHEYWFAPLAFDYSAISTSFINQHIYYTHTEGLVVLDAYSGEVVDGDNLVALLNRTETINVYYGEGEGFGSPVFVNVPGFEEVGNDSHTAQPDYTLSGFESTFFILTMGPEGWSFMGQDLNMLVQRDVISRVQSILLQGLVVDQDSYIVVDPLGDVYYAVSVFTDYDLSTGYAHENYLRFFGLVLVDITDGSLTFYKQPGANGTFFIDKTYNEYYDWQETPDWLQSQMRWPEDLYERQLDIAYIYHVKDGFVWRSGVDFHQPPEGSDTRYIIMRIAGEERFVAMHNAEFYDSIGRNLAGIYVMGCGDKGFGDFAFYGSGAVGMSTLLGPNAAEQAFETNDEVRTQLQLWGKHRTGNRLLYPLGGDLFFVIPVFLEVQTSADSVIEKLGGVGLVDAATGQRVTLGSNVVEAYYKMFGLLNKTVVEEGEVGIESVVFTPVTVDSGEFARLVTALRNNDNTSHHLYLDISVAAGNFSVVWHGTQVIPTVYAGNRTYTLDIGNVGSGDLYGTSPQITAYLPTGVVLSTYLIVVTLRTEEGITDQITLMLTVT